MSCDNKSWLTLLRDGIVARGDNGLVLGALGEATVMLVFIFGF